MRTLLTVLGLVAVMGLSARAGAPSGVAGGGLFVESEASASSKVTVSGEFRSRWEMIRQNLTDFNSRTPDREEWVDSRLRLGLRFELAAGTEVFVQPTVRYVWGADGEEDDLLLYQGYIKFTPEIFGYDTVLTIGRMELEFGSEMLLGNDTKYAGISHDAVRLDVKLIDDLSTTLFIAKVAEGTIAGADETLGLATTGTFINDTHLWGVWNTYEINEDALIDFYLLYLQSDVEFDGTALEAATTTGEALAALAAVSEFNTDAKIWTLGARFKINKFEVLGQKFDYSLEIAAQAGTVNFGGEPTDGDGVLQNDLDIKDSFAFETELGWSPELPWSPRWSVGMAWASGDDELEDGNINHFFPMFQETQGRLGKADLFTLTNLRCWYTTITFNPMDSEKLSAGISFLRFNAFEEYDALGTGGNQLVGSSNNDIGDEYDVFMAYEVNENADLKFCWSYIEPEDMIHDSMTTATGNSPAHRLHLTLIVKF
jgi:Alginate export